MALNLPTDNLYKFGFVGSLLFSLFIYNIIESRNDEQFKTLTKLSMEMYMLSLEDSVLVIEFDKEIRMGEEMIENTKTKKDISIKLDVLQGKLDTLKNKESSLINRVKTRSKEHKGIISTEERLLKKSESDLNYLIASLLSTVIFGFLWYFNVQRYLDIDLKNKVIPKKKY